MHRNDLFSVLAACASIAISYSPPAHAKSQMQTDNDYMQYLFKNAVDVRAPSMIKCGMRADLETMIQSVEFLEAAYRRLYKGFPVSNPPIDEQMRERIKLSCQLFGCSEPKSADACEPLRKPWVMSPYSEAVDKAKLRLQQRGISNIKRSSTQSAQSDSCPQRAQFYQDAYVKSSRVEDLVCFKQAMNRELK